MKIFNRQYKKSLPANSIMEVVIAISIITIGISVLTIVYISLHKNSITMKEIKDQSEFQTQLFQHSFVLEDNENLTWKSDETSITKTKEVTNDFQQVTHYLKNSRGKTLWIFNDFEQ